MLACHVLCVFEVGLVVAIVLARMQARSPFMPSMDLEAAVFDLGPLIVRQNNWVAAVAAAITEVFCCRLQVPVARASNCCRSD